MTNHPFNHRGASAPALLAALAITPVLLSSCLSRSDRETIEIPPAPVGQVVETVDAATVAATEAGTGARPAEPAEPPYSLDDAIKYVIQDGDTLSTIAEEHDVSLSDVKRANKIANANKIRSGQTLLLPGTATASEGEAPGDAEEVGETEAAAPAVDTAGLTVPDVSGE